ncbi:MAG TPA: response regulator transcription factor [Pseudonocardia sp.]|nr:response regulator transcription factor [Pseudonocardia sp.]
MGRTKRGSAPGGDVEAVKVLVVDDHRMFTEVLRLGIEEQPGFECVGVAHCAREALARASTTEFDVALVDLELPDADGLDIISSLLAQRPLARVLILTAFARSAHARRALDAGAAGFLGKEATLSTVFNAISAARASSPTVSPPLPLSERPAVELTPREHDVLRELGLGHEAARIADTLGISLYTTRDHIKALMRKLGVQSQLSAVVTAERLGLLRVGRRF